MSLKGGFWGCLGCLQQRFEEGLISLGVSWEMPLGRGGTLARMSSDWLSDMSLGIVREGMFGDSSWHVLRVVCFRGLLLVVVSFQSCSWPVRLWLANYCNSEPRFSVRMEAALSDQVLVSGPLSP